MKKILSSILVLSLIMALLAGCTGTTDETPNGSADNEKATLVVSHFGLSEDAQWELILRPFEEEHNVEIVLEVGNNAERLTKVESNPNTEVDIIYLAQSYAQQGWEADLFEELDYSKIPNSEHLTDKVDFLVDQGQGPAYAVNRAGIIYNKDAIDFEINSWEDLWRPELEGNIAIPQLSTTFGPTMMYAASYKAGVDFKEDDGEAAFQALEELKPNIVRVYNQSSDLINLMETGEIVAAVGPDFAFSRMVRSDSDLDVGFVDPIEGSFLNFNTINIIKSSDQKDLAYEFINYALSNETQERALGIPDAPVNTNVEVPSEQAETMTYGEDLDNGQVMDFEYINSMLDEWIDRWNRTLN